MLVKFLTENNDIINEVNSFITEWNTPSSYISIYTSGSTGKPKEIVLQKKHMKASALMTGEFLKLSAGGNALLCMNPKTIAGKMMIVRSIILKLNLLVVEPSNNPLEFVKQQIDFTAMVPSQIANSIDKIPLKLKEIGTIIIGGAPIHSELFKLISNLKLSIFQTFGMTETISHVAMREIIRGNQYFYALPGVSFSQKEDCLIISAPHLGINALETNDLVSLKNSTSFEWVGRKDFAINSGGVKIHPEQIENELSKLIKAPFFSTGIADEKFGTKHILCMEGTTSFSKKQLSKYLNKYSLPKEIYLFEQFIYTESNKINKQSTLKLLSNAKKQIL